jgi:FMN phosphatase YigB (HAD superfamily)
MGVLFQAADDVAELLIPFVAECGGELKADVVQSAYLDASLGNIEPDEFWARVQLDPAFEDEYLSRHSLSLGVMELLSTAQLNEIPVWCLFNDVGRWSHKLRKNYAIEELLAGTVISGDVRHRKPDSRIYKELLSRSGCSAEDILFVDDRPKNIQAAQALGIEAIQYFPRRGFGEVTARMANALK